MNEPSLKDLEQKLAKGQSVLLPASGLSMGNAFKGVDRFLVKPATPDEPAIGSIVVFKDRDGLTGHRLLWKKKQEGKVFFITRGDGNRYIDPAWDAHEKLVGEVAGLFRGEQLEPMTGSLPALQGFAWAASGWFKLGLQRFLPMAMKGMLRR